jgi:hypothetical protein
MNDLKETISPFNIALQDMSPKELESLIQKLCADLLETAPALCEYKAALDESGVSDYKITYSTISYHIISILSEYLTCCVWTVNFANVFHDTDRKKE